jgi:hypothetical protein
MKDEQLAAVVLACLVAGSGWAAYSIVSTTGYCPPPSASSAAALFAPCQAFATTIERAVVMEQEALQKGLPTADQQPLLASTQPPAYTTTQFAAKDDTAYDHATVGIAASRPRH